MPKGKKQVRRSSGAQAMQRTLDVSLWRRFFAYFIDTLIVGFFIVLPLSSFSYDVMDADLSSFTTSLSEEQPFTVQNFFLGFFMALFTILYWALFEYYLGQTLGKMALKIKVIQDVPTKRTLSRQLKFHQCFLRNVTKISTFILFLDVLYGIFKGNKQRFFERISHTHVVHATP